MLSKIALDKKIRITFDSQFPIVGTVTGVERDEEDGVTAILFRTVLLNGVGTLRFEACDLQNGRVTLEYMDEWITVEQVEEVPVEMYCSLLSAPRADQSMMS